MVAGRNNEYDEISFLGRYLIRYHGEPCLIVDSMTNAQAIMAILDADTYGEVYRHNDSGVIWKDEESEVEE